MKILLSAFEAFDGRDINASEQALMDVANTIAGADIAKLLLPVSFLRAADIIKHAIDRYRPDAVLLLGEAAGRDRITPERVAINCDDARIADNDGYQPIDEPIDTDGPSAYFSTLPIKKMVEYMNSREVPAAISNTAGTYVCNHLMYEVLDYVEKQYPEMIAGFMHVPLIDEQLSDDRKMPRLSKEELIRGVEASLEAIIDSLT